MCDSHLAWKQHTHIMHNQKSIIYLSQFTPHSQSVAPGSLHALAAPLLLTQDRKLPSFASGHEVRADHLRELSPPVEELEEASELLPPLLLSLEQQLQLLHSSSMQSQDELLAMASAKANSLSERVKFKTPSEAIAPTAIRTLNLFIVLKFFVNNVYRLSATVISDGIFAFLSVRESFQSCVLS